MISQQKLRLRLWLTMIVLWVVFGMVLFVLNRVATEQGYRFTTGLKDMSWEGSAPILFYQDHSGNSTQPPQIFSADGTILYSGQWSLFPTEKEQFVVTYPTMQLYKLTDSALVEIPLPSYLTMGPTHVDTSPDQRFLIWQGFNDPSQFAILDRNTQTWSHTFVDDIPAVYREADVASGQTGYQYSFIWERSEPHLLFVGIKAYLESGALASEDSVRYHLNPEQEHLQPFIQLTSTASKTDNNSSTKCEYGEQRDVWLSTLYIRSFSCDLTKTIRITNPLIGKQRVFYQINNGPERELTSWFSTLNRNSISIQFIPDTEHVLILINDQAGILDLSTGAMAHLMDLPPRMSDDIRPYEFTILNP